MGKSISVLRTDTDFLKWVNGGSFYLGYVRYSTLFRGAMLCAISWDEDDELRKLVDDVGSRYYQELNNQAAPAPL